MRLNPNFILKRIGEVATLVPFGQALVDFNCMASFNSVGTYLVELLKEERTFEELVESTTARFAVDSGTARRDVGSFLDRLRADGMLVEDARP